MFCFILFLVRIKKTEMATKPTISGIPDFLKEMKMTGCRNLRGLVMQLKARDTCIGLRGGARGKKL